MRITALDVTIWVNHVNDLLRANGKNTIASRKHYDSGYTRLYRTNTNGEESEEPFFTGTKAECVDILRAMVRMGAMLTES